LGKREENIETDEQFRQRVWKIHVADIDEMHAERQKNSPNATRERNEQSKRRMRLARGIGAVMGTLGACYLVLSPTSGKGNAETSQLVREALPSDTNVVAAVLQDPNALFGMGLCSDLLKQEAGILEKRLPTAINQTLLANTQYHIKMYRDGAVAADAAMAECAPIPAYSEYPITVDNVSYYVDRSIIAPDVSALAPRG
jgi:hypothetical protein